MIAFYKLSALIISAVGKLIARSIISVSIIVKHICGFRMSIAERRYKSASNKYNYLLYENAKLRNELKKYKQAHAINLQRIHKMEKKHSCFCERLKIIVFKLTHNADGEDIENLFGYTYRTISRWFCLLNRFGLLGIFPKGKFPWSSRFKTPNEIVQLVWTIHKDNPSWGRWKIAQAIWLLAVFISPSTVRNILKYPRPRLFRRKRRPKSPDTDNHTRQIKTSRTNQIWSIDLCTTITGPYQVSILAILDHFSRKILHMTTFFGEPPDEWITNSIRSAFAEYNTPKAIITDHGGQFESFTFKQFLKNCCVEHRQGRASLPYSNGKIERFFLSLQKEVLNYYPILTYKKLGNLLMEYKTYYNQYRPHQSINGGVPENIYIDDSLSYKIPDKIQKRINGNIKTRTFCDGLIKGYSLMN